MDTQSCETSADCTCIKDISNMVNMLVERELWVNVDTNILFQHCLGNFNDNFSTNTIKMILPGSVQSVFIDSEYQRSGGKPER